MTKQRIHFKITIEGSLDMDLDEDDCPLHEFSSLSGSSNNSRIARSKIRVFPRKRQAR